MKEKDMTILANLRGNSRESLTRLSRKTRIPVSTLFERMKSYNNDIVKKYTSIVNFEKLGYKTRAQILIKPWPETKEKVEEFLQKNKHVNSLFRVSTNFEYLAEVICTNMQEFHSLLAKLEELRIEQKEVLFVIDELRREDFLTTESSFILGGWQNEGA